MFNNVFSLIMRLRKRTVKWKFYWVYYNFASFRVIFKIELQIQLFDAFNLKIWNIYQIFKTETLNYPDLVIVNVPAQHNVLISNAAWMYARQLSCFPTALKSSSICCKVSVKARLPLALHVVTNEASYQNCDWWKSVNDQSLH